MTDRETLFQYRLNQAEETLADACKMIHSGVGPRSVVNRAYYAIFYAVHALIIYENIELKSSRHSGIISLFDKMFVHTGRLGREYSKFLHRLFEARQEADYREFVVYSVEDAAECIRMAESFLDGVKALIRDDAEQ